MNPADLLSLIAELAIAITGFAGIVSVFGRGAAQPWQRSDYMRLVSLLTASLSAFFLCVVTLTALSVGQDLALAATLLSVPLLVERLWWLSRFARNRQTLDNSSFTLTMFYVFVAGNTLIVLLAMANLTYYQSFWPFGVCLLWYLLESAYVFVRLVLRRVVIEESRS